MGSSASRMAGFRQRTRNGYALLLTSGKLRRIVLGAMVHSHTFKRLLHSRFALGRGHASISEG